MNIAYSTKCMFRGLKNHLYQELMFC